MGSGTGDALRILIVFDDADETSRLELRKHLKGLARTYAFTVWDRKEVKPGGNEEEETSREADRANLVLVLLSPDLLASSELHSPDFEWIMQRHKARRSRTVPILVRACEFQAEPLLQGVKHLSVNGAPIANHADKDTAWAAITEELRNLVKRGIEARRDSTPSFRWNDTPQPPSAKGPKGDDTPEPHPARTSRASSVRIGRNGYIVVGALALAAVAILLVALNYSAVDADPSTPTTTSTSSTTSSTSSTSPPRTKECPDGMGHVPGGTFHMGSNEERQSPIRRITVKSFCLDLHEVTVREYKRCEKERSCSKPGMGEGCNWTDADRDDHPINCVDWSQASIFCTWRGATLPSEAQWEYAARGGDKNWMYPTGDTLVNSICFPKLGTCPADFGVPARWGHTGLAGNVAEWVQDWYAPYNKNVADDRPNLTPSSHKVLRGGHYRSEGPGWVRGSYRGTDGAGVRWPYAGFRCATPPNH